MDPAGFGLPDPFFYRMALPDSGGAIRVFTPRPASLAMIPNRSSRLALLMLCLAMIHTPAWADDEPTEADCKAAMDTTRALATALPPDDLSRYFAERYLLQSAAEAGNGEYDDCIYWAKRGEADVREHRHKLKPGETLNVPWPKPPAPAPTAPAPAKPGHAKRGGASQPAASRPEPPADPSGTPPKQG